MSTRYLSLLLFLFPLLHQPASTAPPRTGKDLAVFFAVEKYQNGSLTNLQNPVKNAREIAATLQSRFGFETEVLENPTQAQIIAKLTILKLLLLPKFSLLHGPQDLTTLLPPMQNASLRHHTIKYGPWYL